METLGGMLRSGINTVTNFFNYSCKVKECEENHQQHFCKVCQNNDVDHRSSNCPKRLEPRRGVEDWTISHTDHNRKLGTNSDLDNGGRPSKIAGCRVTGCSESHAAHFCRNCQNADSDHFSSVCPHMPALGNSFKTQRRTYPGIRSEAPGRTYDHPTHYSENCQHTDANHHSSESTVMLSKTFRSQSFSVQSTQIAGHTSSSYDSGHRSVVNSYLEIIWSRSSSPELYDLKDIMSHILFGRKPGDLNALEEFVEELCVDEKKLFLLKVLPFMASLALKVTTILPQFPVRLTQLQTGRVELSQRQCCCLLCLAFFDIPPVWDCADQEEHVSFRFCLAKQKEKLKCLFCYFAIMQQRSELGGDDHWGLRKVLFIRHSLPSSNMMELRNCLLHCYMPLQQPSIQYTGAIEECADMLQADFANKRIGGGVLGKGCVQEELRFLICPECIVSRYFCEDMADSESIFIIGAERFSSYVGYGQTFKFGNAFVDSTPLRDGEAILDTVIVAFDALDVSNNPIIQYKENYILREMLKLFAALSVHPDIESPSMPKPFATGNWGCGAFGGDPQLKFLLQWIMCTCTNRKMTYLPFGENMLANVDQLVSHLTNCNMTVSWMTSLLFAYEKTLEANYNQNVFDFLLSVL